MITATAAVVGTEVHFRLGWCRAAGALSVREVEVRG